MANYTDRDPASVCRELRTTDEDLLAIGREELVRMMMLLYIVRDFERKVLDLKDADLVHGPAHTSVGQEAVAVGVAAALRKGDMIGSTHRAHGHFLAKALMHYAPDGYRPLEQSLTPEMQDAVNRTLAEIMGLKAGWCGGRGGSMHLFDDVSGNLGSNAIVGGGIPLATGAAWAETMRGRDTVVVSFFGDGAMNQGSLHEVANMAGLYRVPVIYLIENNQYAVGTRCTESSNVCPLALRALGYGIDGVIVDGMDPVAMYVATRDAAERMRAEPYPLFLEALTYRHVHHAGSLAGSAYGYRNKDEEAQWQGRDPVENLRARLQAYGLLGAEEDAHLQELARASIARAEGLCVVERDGARVIPADRWPEPESALVGARGTAQELSDLRMVERADLPATRPMTYVEAIAGVTLRSMARDERVFVLGEEVANLRGGAYAATRGIKEVHPDRLINTPISETGFLGMAGGAAAVGMRPVVEVMFPDFALMASDQLFNQIGKLRHMYGNRVCFPLVVRTRVAMGFGYGGQHSMDPSALFSMFSGWRVLAPSTAFDYVGLFNTAMRLKDPVLIVEHGLLYAEQDQVPEGDLDYYIAYGKANVLREGEDITVVCYSYGTRLCLQAAEVLAGQGISAEVIDLRTVDYNGIDYETIGRSLRKTGTLVVVEQSPRSQGLGARIADDVQLRFFDELDGPVAHVTAPDVPLPVSKKLEEWVLPSVEVIVTGVRAWALRAV